MPDGQQLVLAQNQHAFVQDATKGTVQVYAGPHSLGLSPNDKPVVYDNATDSFRPVSLTDAIKQNPMVPEGHYLVLENPAFKNDATLHFPGQGANSPTTLQVGRKINIAGPTTFPLWPGQFAKAIPGHHLRSNQYLVVRVYNAEQANKSIPHSIAKATKTKELANGQLFVIKGTEVPFFIPPTGFEVLAEGNQYVREALTLERLEYCILLDENGMKRFERGPQVVFPEATETFMTKKDNENGAQSRKFKAIELNDQMGLYIKVIADYEEGDQKFTAGDELFITGKQQRIYYPRSEHALIEYKDPKGFSRQRYYGIAIPKGEGRYVLVKDAGDVRTEDGPQIFLPDPRNQVIVRRVLDDKTVQLWYPGNTEALEYNENLRELLEETTGGSGDNYLADSLVRSASVGADRSLNRMTKGSRTLAASAAIAGSFEGDKLDRGTQFTPPPTLTLNTKYDGVPQISPYVGYAVQVVDKGGKRRVEVGPTTILLAYDETLAVLELSTGKPKTTDSLYRTVYLRVDNNLVSDIVNVETNDLVSVNIKLSYRVNFVGHTKEERERWFAVENYVKYLCDHMRSVLKGAVKKHGVKDFIEHSTAIVRDTVLGVKEEGKQRHFFFPENGMDVYDVEVLSVQIADNRIADLLKNAQQTAVQNAINLSVEEQNLKTVERRTSIQGQVAELEHNLAAKKLELDTTLETKEAEAVMTRLEQEIAQAVARMNSEVEKQSSLDTIAEKTLARRKNDENFTIELEEARVEMFKTKFEAITPDLIQAMYTLGQTEFTTKLSTALAPLAINEQIGLGQTLERVFKGTALENILDNLKGKPAKAGN
jgi:major vault protein